MAAKTDTDLNAALSRLDEAGLLAAAGDTAEDAATANSKRRVASRFAGVAKGWDAVAYVVADRRRLACALAVSEADYFATMRDRLGRTGTTPAVPADKAAVLQHTCAAETSLANLPLTPGGAGSAWVAGLLVLNSGGATCLTLVSGRIDGVSRIVLAALPSRAQDTLRPLLAQGAEASLVVGAHPACALAAALNGAEGGHDWATAAALADRPLPVVAVGNTTVPADAALALHGRVNAAGDVVVFDVSAIHHRDDPVVHWMAGPALNLDAFSLEAAAVELALARHLSNVEGGLDVLDVRCYPESENQVAAVKLRPRVEGQSKTAMIGALSSPDLRPSLVIGVDEDIDLGSLRDVAWSAASRLHGEIDIAQIADAAVALADGTPTPAAGLGTKWFIDSTMPPLTQPPRRATFERAIPKNLLAVRLADFLPD